MKLAGELEGCRDSRGRYVSAKVLEAARRYISCLAEEPEGGWLAHCYCAVLERLFPITAAQWEGWDGKPVAHSGDGEFRLGRLVLMQLLHGLYQYERAVLPFDPTVDFDFLDDEEIMKQGYTREYLHMIKMLEDQYIYEFMRIGSEIPLQHAGPYCRRPLRRPACGASAGLPRRARRPGLISGAALCHDLGKYGCKKNEEKRVPYLHYYYTDACCRRVGLSGIGHIAANHSVWDLELENLSVESLLLIYADFRVKSSRDAQGREVVHFYTLKEAFDVILGKLDNVDEAKRHRYQKVYAKLADFESFMREKGVVELPADLSRDHVQPDVPEPREWCSWRREKSSSS